jgi:hypothetical protein
MNGGFQLPKKEHITPTHLFNTSVAHLDLAGVDVSASLDSYHYSRQSKTIRRFAIAPAK